MGWAQELFGLFSDFAVRSAVEKQTLFRQRYLRKGVYDTLPASASDYHKALAICADDVVYERAIELTLQVNLKANVDIKNSPAERDIENLRRDIQLITARRATMSRRESNLCGFQNAVSDIIHHYSDRICTPRTQASFMVILALQLELRRLLSPWLLVKAFMSVGGKWKWGLSPPGQPVQAPQPNSGLETIPSFVEMGRVMFIDLKLETIRAQILRNETLQGDELQMALCFRRFLETGQEAQMPLMAMGLRRRRDITIVEYNETSAIKCAEGCTCSLSTQQDRKKMLAAKRKGNDPAIVGERRKIQACQQRLSATARNLAVLRFIAISVIGIVHIVHLLILADPIQPKTCNQSTAPAASYVSPPRACLSFTRSQVKRRPKLNEFNQLTPKPPTDSLGVPTEPDTSSKHSYVDIATSSPPSNRTQA
ncbi:uncharacterized protein A1O5_13360 [Cladophialophora psammophila CBS 110553]|uniref:Uncharacterized protein n=1 Tax=Cladophialophora psammophila CBS 110553 TaxID=1182543 RepID=W9VMT0_9EURO|nr:uncharacterized protein A1O5_13360 [Cladophialophora psammophila CBS 110553]EXJ53426.1 hypothetical protein A1O5_13360 [Cladophialophora psammophila CBS 110553]